MLNKLNATLFIIFILGVLGLGAMMYFGINEKSKQATMQAELDAKQAEEEARLANEAMQNLQIANDSIDQNFLSLSNESLFELTKSSGLSYDESGVIALGQTLDLTGDDLHEAVFVGNSGNSTVSTILLLDENGVTTVASQKNQDGTVAPVMLTQVARAQVSADYKLLPEEFGYYTATFSLVKNTQDFKCDANGLNAYAWNPISRMFEWNQTLVDKYTAQVCI